MINFTEIAFSCYAVTDMARARAFYEGVLGLKNTVFYGKPDGSMQWAEFDIGPGTISIGSAPGWKPSSDGCSVALEVADFDAAISHLKSAGVKFRIEPIETPVCRMAMIFDPDQNCICIHHRKAK
jgi:predicted enzyme related to lactoylglutathione lyase